MSRLRIFRDDDPTVPLSETTDPGEMARALGDIGVRFERWAASEPVAPGASQEAVLAAYRADVDRIMAAQGFEGVDVVSLSPDHPKRAELRGKFLDEHTHGEDEVRFFVGGAGLFSLRPGGRVYEVLCEAGDLISVPAGLRHWFDMGPEPSFIAIRFFGGPDGWVGHFTGDDIAQRFPRYEPGQAG
jgi:1,2-dihydroxy-3-keto-5-methylthiopentene dioxygenase